MSVTISFLFMIFNSLKALSGSFYVHCMFLSEKLFKECSVRRKIISCKSGFTIVLCLAIKGGNSFCKDGKNTFLSKYWNATFSSLFFVPLSLLPYILSNLFSLPYFSISQTFFCEEPNVGKLITIVFSSLKRFSRKIILH